MALKSVQVEVLGKTATPLARAAFDLFVRDADIAELTARLSRVSQHRAKAPRVDPAEWPEGTDPKVIEAARAFAGVSSVEKFRFQRLDIDIELPAYRYVWRSIWADETGHKKLWTDTPAEQAVIIKPWDIDCAPTFEPEDRHVATELSLLAQAEWQSVEKLLLGALNDGSAFAVAKIGSPITTEFSTIPTDAWPEVTVTDWDRGTATIETGERLFALHILDEPPVEPIKRESRAKLPVMRGRTQLIIADVFPDGVPSDLTDEALLAEVHARWTVADGNRPSKDTVKRAAGRR